MAADANLLLRILGENQSAKEALREVEQELREIDRLNAEATATINVRNREELRRALAEMNRFARTRANAVAAIRVTGQAALRAAMLQLQRWGRMRETAVANLRVTGGEAGIAHMKQWAATARSARRETDGLAGSTFRMSGAIRQSGAGAQAASSGYRVLGSSIRGATNAHRPFIRESIRVGGMRIHVGKLIYAWVALKGVMRTATIAMTGARMGAILPLGAGAIAAAGALGGMGVAGLAVGGVLKGLSGVFTNTWGAAERYNQAVINSGKNSKEAKDALKELEATVGQGGAVAAAAAQKYSVFQQALAKALQPAQLNMWRAMNVVYSNAIKLVPAYAAQVNNASRALLGFFKWIFQAPRIAQMNSILKGMTGIWGPLGSAARSVAQIFLNIAQAAMPMLVRGVTRLAGGLRRLAGALTVDRLSRAFAVMEKHLMAVEKLASTVGKVLTEFFRQVLPHAARAEKLLQQIGDDLLGWLKSDRGRRDIKDFLDTAVPLADKFARLIGKVAQAFITWYPLIAQFVEPLVEGLTFIMDKLGDFGDLIKKGPGWLQVLAGAAAVAFLSFLPLIVLAIAKFLLLGGVIGLIGKLLKKLFGKKASPILDLADNLFHRKKDKADDRLRRNDRTTATPKMDLDTRSFGRKLLDIPKKIGATKGVAAVAGAGVGAATVAALTKPIPPGLERVKTEMTTGLNTKLTAVQAATVPKANLTGKALSDALANGMRTGAPNLNLASQQMGQRALSGVGPGVSLQALTRGRGIATNMANGMRSGMPQLTLASLQLGQRAVSGVGFVAPQAFARGRGLGLNVANGLRTAFPNTGLAGHILGLHGANSVGLANPVARLRGAGLGLQAVAGLRGQGVAAAAAGHFVGIRGAASVGLAAALARARGASVGRAASAGVRSAAVGAGQAGHFVGARGATGVGQAAPSARPHGKRVGLSAVTGVRGTGGAMGTAGRNIGQTGARRGVGSTAPMWVTVARGLGAKLAGGITSMQGKARAAGVTAGGRGKDGAKSTTPQWTGVGKAFIDAMKAAIHAGIPGLENAAAASARAAVNAAKRNLVIHSPSRVMRNEVGIPMMQGWANGIKAGTSRVTAAARTAANAAVRAAKGPTYPNSVLNRGTVPEGELRDSAVTSKELSEALKNDLKGSVNTFAQKINELVDKLRENNQQIRFLNAQSMASREMMNRLLSRRLYQPYVNGSILRGSDVDFEKSPVTAAPQQNFTIQTPGNAAIDHVTAATMFGQLIRYQGIT